MDAHTIWSALNSSSDAETETETETETNTAAFDQELDELISLITDIFNDVKFDIESEDHRFSPEAYSHITSNIEYLINKTMELKETVRTHNG